MNLRFAILLVPIVIVTILSLKKYTIGEFTPTIIWTFFMVIPFIYSSFSYTELSASRQFIGIFLISLACFSGDSIAFLRNQKFSLEFVPTLDHFSLFKTVYLNIFSFCCLLFVIIYAYMGWPIPLIQLLNDHHYSSNVAYSRELFDKFTQPYLISIAKNIMLFIFAPLLLFTLLIARRVKTFILMILVFLFLSLVTTAQGVSILFLALSIGTFYSLLPTNIQKQVERIVLLGLFLLSILTISYSNSVLNSTQDCNLPKNVEVTTSNVMRQCSQNSTFPKKGYVIERLTYRIFHVPAEVSHVWYRYFSEIEQPNRKYSKLFIIGSPEPPTENVIGNWYYTSNFPENYSSNISAYASIDADAFSFYGLRSQIWTAFVLFLVRIFFSIRSSNFQLGKALDYLAILHLSLFLNSASIQAILFSNGLLFLIIFKLFLYFVYYRKYRRAKY